MTDPFFDQMEWRDMHNIEDESLAEQLAEEAAWEDFYEAYLSQQEPV